MKWCGKRENAKRMELGIVAMKEEEEGRRRNFQIEPNIVPSHL